MILVRDNTPPVRAVKSGDIMLTYGPGANTDGGAWDWGEMKADDAPIAAAAMTRIMNIFDPSNGRQRRRLLRLHDVIVIGGGSSQQQRLLFSDTMAIELNSAVWRLATRRQSILSPAIEDKCFLIPPPATALID
mmetsp:Transcript_34488/g.83451  ORF Transcript_34488/g.83451 Transcript_34488/m.83451 type:complete len:134 (-) Transcript_34488:98-499(-)